MAEDLTTIAVVTALVVAAIAVALAALGWRAYSRTGNGRLRFVTAAFALFAIKNLFSAYNVQTHLVPHDAIEWVLSLFDLAILGVIFFPFLARRGRGP